MTLLCTLIVHSHLSLVIAAFVRGLLVPSASLFIVLAPALVLRKAIEAAEYIRVVWVLTGLWFLVWSLPVSFVSWRALDLSVSNIQRI